MLVKVLLDALNGGKPISSVNPLQVSDPNPESVPVTEKVTKEK